jgi:hypothetical protein
MTIAHLLLPALMGMSALAPGNVRAEAPAVRPIAVVGTDTLSTTDLKIELGIMQSQMPADARSSLPAADLVLRRLIQNRLVLQEGYRMGLEQEFSVSNQVLEFVRLKTMAALLDSVAAAVPAGTEDVHGARRLAVDRYLKDLRKRYGATADEALLASLDYGSADPDVQKRLREDTAVLAVVPTGSLTVSAFSRILRFTEFHGLVGKVNAAEKRDKAFREWLSEAVLFHQATVQKVAERPQFVTLARRYEENLVLQEALRLLLQGEFEPAEKDIKKFYRNNLELFTAAPRVKMESLKVANRTQALELSQKMKDGAPVGWLKKNVAGVVQGPAPFPSEFFEPAKLGLRADEMSIGWVPTPYQVPGGWVVAKVIEIETPEPAPMENVRTEVLGMMKAEQTRLQMTDIIGRLEEATPVVILPDAEAIVAETIEDFNTRNAAADDAAQSPGQEG